MSTYSIHSRRIRVFLSSTFQDMQKERDYLIKKTFPAIKRIAEERNVEFSVVDLRWGVTEEEAHQGKVIEICLNEVKDTHPFFIGIIGDRYGWCPTMEDIEKNERLLSAYPIVKDYVRQHMSMTEMEVQYALHEAEDSMYTNFYLKEAHGVTADQPDEDKLQILRQKIAEKAAEGLCQMQHYSTPKELGDCIYQSLLALIDKLYPKSHASSEEVTADRQRYLLSQYQMVYHNQAAIAMLESAIEELNGKCWCTLVTSLVGWGKTALIANWRKEDPHIIRTLFNEDMDSAQEALQHLKWEISSLKLDKKEVVWILDGIENLSPEDSNLAWLSNSYLKDVNLILTTSDSQLEKNIQAAALSTHRTFRKLSLPSPSIEEKKQITIDYLKLHAKSLTDAQLERIAGYKPFNNFQTYTFFLQMLIQSGVHEKIDEFISGFTKTEVHVHMMYYLFIAEIRDECGKEAVETYFGMLTLSQYGIPEDELQRFTGLNAIDWAALNNAVNMFVVRTNGLIRIHGRIRPYLKQLFVGEKHKEVNDQWRRHLIDLYTRMRDDLIRQDRHESFTSFCMTTMISEYYGSHASQIANLQAEIIDHYIELGEAEKLFSKMNLIGVFSCSKSKQGARIISSYVSYVNGSADRLISGINYKVLFLSKDVIGTVIDGIITDSIERTKIRRYIEHKWFLPRNIKKDILKKGLVPQTTAASDNTPMEDKWEKMELDELGSNAVTKFTQITLPYILSKDRVLHIEQKADNVFKRVHAQTYDIDLSLNNLYQIKAYCLYRRNEPKEALEYLVKASQIAPLMPDNIIYFLVYFANGNGKECRSIMGELRSMLDRTTIEDTQNYFSEVLYSMEMIYAVWAQNKEKEDAAMAEIQNLYSDSAHAKYRFLFRLATLLHITSFNEKAGEMLQYARTFAQNETQKDECILYAKDYYIKAKRCDKVRTMIKQYEADYIAEGKISQARFMRLYYAQSYYHETAYSYMRSHIKQCYETYMQLAEEILQYSPDEVGQDFYRKLHANYDANVCFGELFYHLWGANHPKIQEAAEDMQKRYEEKVWQDMTFNYFTCMMVAERLDKAANVVNELKYDQCKQLLFLKQSNDTVEKEKLIRKNVEFMLHRWDNEKPISVDKWSAIVAHNRRLRYANHLWDRYFEPYNLPYIQALAKDSNNPFYPNAVAAMLFYSYITDNTDDLAYYQKVASGINYPMVQAAMQCIAPINQPQ